MLRVESILSGYTTVDVLRHVTLEVPERGIVGVLGANGAGKTALMRAISGLNRVRAGRIVFDGHELSGERPDAIMRRGVVQVPQGRMLFGEMSVRENLELGAYLQPERRAIEQQLEIVQGLFPILKDRSNQAAAYLSGGEQQMLAIGRALMSRPRLLLLDEPSLGLAPKTLDAILDKVRAINSEGAAVLIAEQNARKVLRLADHCYVMENGTVAFDGRSDELLHDDRIERTYLGAGH